jgi:hypothetical protein
MARTKRTKNYELLQSTTDPISGPCVTATISALASEGSNRPDLHQEEIRHYLEIAGSLVWACSKPASTPLLGAVVRNAFFAGSGKGLSRQRVSNNESITG